LERFVRLEASRTLPGSGLGLSLGSAVATLHGGELRLGDSHPGLIATLAIPALAANTAFSSEVDAGSREENASKQKARA